MGRRRKPTPFSVPYDDRVRDFFLKNSIFLKAPYNVDNVFVPGGRVSVAPNVVVEPGASMPPRRFLSMGAWSVCLTKSLPVTTTIGRYCLIAEGVRVMGINHPSTWITSHPFAFRPYVQNFAKKEFGKTILLAEFDDLMGDVTIEHDVFVGEDALIRKGVTLGTGSVIAAGAVVTKDVAPYAVVAGIPARVIRMRYPAPIVERMMAAAWWRYHPDDIQDLPMDDPVAFMDALEQRVAKGAIQPYAPEPLPLAQALADHMAAADTDEVR